MKKHNLIYFAINYNKWVFPKIGVPQNGWFIMENPIKMDDLGVPPFKETPKCSYDTPFLSNENYIYHAGYFLSPLRCPASTWLVKCATAADEASLSIRCTTSVLRNLSTNLGFHWGAWCFSGELASFNVILWLGFCCNTVWRIWDASEVNEGLVQHSGDI